MILLLVATARAEDPDDFQAAVEQARFFVKKGWWEDARTQLELAVSTENGRLDPEAWMLLATVTFQLCDVAAARHAADRAHSNSRDLQQAEQAAGLRTWLDQQFGLLTVNASYDGVVTQLTIDLQSSILDPELKLYLSRLQDRLQDVTSLPATFSLPAGRYVVNDVAVEVIAGGSSAVLPRAPGGALQAAQIEFGFGPTLWLGEDLAGELPVPTTSLAVAMPAGPLQLGLFGAWTPQPFRLTTGEVRISPVGYEVGARVGVELTQATPLHVRASLAYAWGVIPGIGLPCRTGPEGAVCGGVEPGDLWIHLAGQAHQPRAELAILYLDHHRGTSFGGGLITHAGAALGTLRTSAAAVGDTGERYTFSLPEDQAHFVGWSIRSLATLTATF